MKCTAHFDVKVYTIVMSIGVCTMYKMYSTCNCTKCMLVMCIIMQMMKCTAHVAVQSEFYIVQDAQSF